MIGKEDETKKLAFYILEHLPGKDCGAKSPCGLPKCRMFAVKIIMDEKQTNDCPYMDDQQRQAIVLLLDEYYG